MCATDYEFSSIFAVQGLLSVIGREIVSVYPAINRVLDHCVRILNTIVLPRIQTQRHRCRDRVYVMWTQIGGCFPQPQGKTWLPDHFVPLIGNDQIPSGRKTSSPIDADIPFPNFIEDIPSPVKESGKPSSPPTTPPSLGEDCSLLSGSEMQCEPENLQRPRLLLLRTLRSPSLTHSLRRPRLLLRETRNKTVLQIRTNYQDGFSMWKNSVTFYKVTW